jgi:hypothetical protein
MLDLPEWASNARRTWYGDTGRGSRVDCIVQVYWRPEELVVLQERIVQTSLMQPNGMTTPAVRGPQMGA